jgi:hypothetical protein
MNRGLARAFFAALALAGAAHLRSNDAEACGGCFHIPTERVQAVTSHRMVLSVGTRETILWDQFRYSGQPSEFAWVLPVTGDARVELASNAFFDALDLATTVTITPPRCSPSGGGCGASAFGPARSTGAEAGGGVTVLRQESVGPYDTVLLQATGADVLTEWLRANNYVVPGSIAPIIAHYTGMRANFIALKLRPMATVQQMQPVRVRMQGSSMLLPLRMVSAGITDKVGITLWIFAPGRWEAGNFPNAEVLRSRVAWDWSAQRSDYTALSDAIFANDRRTWLSEMSEPASGYVNFAAQTFGNGFGTPTTTLSAEDQQAAMADFTAATQGDLRNYWITRMRADLAATMLDRDLEVRASTASAVLPARFTPIRTRGTPPDGCPSLSPSGCTALPVASAGRAMPALPLVVAALGLALRKLSRSRRARRPS